MRKILPLLLTFLSVSFSYSHSLTVTNLADNGTGSLRATINAAGAGDTIKFDPALLSAGVNDTLYLNSEILIDKGLYFSGSDHDTARIYLSGSGSTRIFKVDISNSSSNSLTFRDYFFINAKAVTGAGDGGALWIVQLDTLKLIDCLFKNCQAMHKGGAIYSRSYTFDPIPKITQISGCQFSHNSAQGYFSGNMDFYMTGPVYIDNCEFSETQQRGSYFDFCEGLYLSNSVIRNNGDSTANSDCIMFWVDQIDTVYANNILAYGNTTQFNDPVIYIRYASSTSLIENSIFYNNHAGEHAGVFSAESDITVRNCQFYNNSAQWGGVTTSEKATFEQCVFKGNSATSLGGVVFYTGNDNGRYTTFYECELDNNSAGNSGGAVYASHTTFRFERSSATRNYSGSYGGAFNLLGYTGSISLLNSTIAENFASDEGGAMQVSNVDSFKIKNCTFAHNISATAGNFIYFTWTDSVEIEGSIIIDHNNPIAYYGSTTNTRLISRGHNILEFDFPGTLGSDLTNIDSTYQILDTLQSFAGIGKVMPPLPKSLAVNRGNPADSSLPQNRNIIAGIRDVGAAESLDSSMVTARHLSVCDSIYLNGGWQHTPGLYIDTLMTSMGVDSVVYVWLDTIKTSIIDTQAVRSCDSYTWIDGNTYSASSDTAKLVFSTPAGCDSIIFLNYIRLTTSVTDTQTVYACSSSYTWIDGHTYFTDMDTASVVLHSLYNCDSTVYLNLVFPRIDTAVSRHNMVLTAVDTNVQYQWVDCSNNYRPLANGSGQQYTVTGNGSYAVILSENGCSDTSGCIEIRDFGIPSFSIPGMAVYPNPTDGNVQVEFTNGGFTLLNIYTASGELVGRYSVRSQSTMELQLDQPPGLYFIEAVEESGNSTYCKIVKQ